MERFQELKKIVQIYITRMNINVADNDVFYDKEFIAKVREASSYKTLESIFAKEDLEDDFDQILKNYFSN